MKRILAITLALCLALTMIPFMAFADSGDPDVNVLIDELDGFVYDNWTAERERTGGAEISTADADKGSYKFRITDGSLNGIVITSKRSFLADGDFEFKGSFSQMSYTGNAFRVSGNNWSVCGPSIKLGDIEFVMAGYVIPQIWYQGTLIAQGTPVIDVPYVLDDDLTDDKGSYGFAVDDGGKLIDSGSEAIAAYLEQTPGKTYSNGYLQSMMSNASGAPVLTVSFKDGKITASADYTKNDYDRSVTVDAPEGVFDDAFAPVVSYKRVIQYENNKYVTIYGASFTCASDDVFSWRDHIVSVRKANISGVFDPADWTGNGVALINSNGHMVGPNSMSLYTMTNVNSYYFGDEWTADIRFTFSGNNNMNRNYVGFRIGNIEARLVNALKDDPVYGKHGSVDLYIDGNRAAWFDLPDGYCTGNLTGITRTDISGTLTVNYKNGKITVDYSKLSGTEIEYDYSDDFSNVTPVITMKSDWMANGRSITQFNANTPEIILNLGYLNAKIGTMADYDDFVNVPDEFAQLYDIYEYLSDDDKAVLTNYGVIEAYFTEKLAHDNLGYFDYNDYLLQGFKSAEWAKTSGTLTFAAVGDCLDSVKLANGEAIYTTKATFDLSDEFHLSYGIAQTYYNTTPATKFNFVVGDVVFSIVPADPANSSMNSFILNITCGDQVLATSDTVGFGGLSGAVADSKLSSTYLGGNFNIDYVDGAVTVKYKGAVIAGAEIAGSHFENVALTCNLLTDWKTLYVTNLLLYAEKTSVDLYKLNKDIATLNNGYKEYPAVAELADKVVPQLSQAKKDAMYNLPTYYRFKNDIKYEGYTYKFMNGFYEREFADTSWIKGAYSHETSETYPGGAVVIDNVQNGKVSVPFNNKFYTNRNYFKAIFNATYGNRDGYMGFTIGDLDFRIVNDTTNSSDINMNGCSGSIVFVVSLKGEIIYAAAAKKDLVSDVAVSTESSVGAYYFSTGGNTSEIRNWTVEYDNGNVTVTYNHYDPRNFVTVDLTTIAGWDPTYTPNGQSVTFNGFQDYGTQRFYNVSLTGKVSSDLIDNLNTLGQTDLAAAKNIYDTMTGAKTDVTVTDIEKSFAVDTTGMDGITTTTVVSDPYTTSTLIRYGRDVTYTATADAGDFIGWFDGDDNLLSTDASYTVTVMPGVTLKAKSCAHANTEKRNVKEASGCGITGYSGDDYCADCGKYLHAGAGIAAPDGHAWGVWQAGDENEPRYHVCDNCGKKEYDASFYSRSLTLGNDITMNFYVKVNENEDTEFAPDTAYAEFTVTGKEGGTTVIPMSEATSDGNGKFKFPLHMNALQMNEKVTARFYYTDGRYVEREVTSIADYVEQLIALHGNDDNNESVRLAKSIANYGYFAQLALAETHDFTVGDGDQFDFREMPHYKEVSVANAADLAAFKSVKSGSKNVPEIQKTSRAIALDEKTDIIVYFTVDGGYVLSKDNVTVVDKDGKSVDFEIAKSGDRFKLVIPGVAAHQLGDMYTVTVNGADGAMTMRLSVMSYVYSTIDSASMSANYKKAVSALYEYYQAAINYQQAKA